MNTRPTPETDAKWHADHFVSETMAREWGEKLERERDEAREQITVMLKHDAKRLESDSIVASCNCDTKTPEVKHHKPGCKYRLICERDDARAFIQVVAEFLSNCHPKPTNPGVRGSALWAELLTDSYPFLKP